MAGLVQRHACTFLVLAALATNMVPVRAYDVEAAARAFRLPIQTVRPVAVIRGWQGSDSAIAERGFERIANVDEWSVLWRRHAPGTAPPAVNFEREMVVAIFGGKSLLGAEFSLHGVAESEMLEVTTMSFVYDVIPPEPTRPYVMVVLPRSDRRVAVITRGYCLMCNPQLHYGVMLELSSPARNLPLKRGDEWRSKGEWDRAIAEYDQAIEDDPGRARAWHGRGTARVGKHEYDRAIADLDQAIRLDPSDADSYNNRCWAGAVVGRDLARALADCDRALQLLPSDSNTLDSRGFVNLRLGRTTEAIADYSGALAANPKLAPALYGRGLARLKAGALEAGKADIQAAKMHQPDIAETFARYGVKAE